MIAIVVQSYLMTNLIAQTWYIVVYIVCAIHEYNYKIAELLFITIII